MGSYFSIVVAHTLKMTVQKYWTIISPQMKSLRRITWFFFSISGSLLAYLWCIYITPCFPSKILMLSKQCARVSWFVLITFIINEVFYIDRTTNLSPWSCNVAMVALIVKKKQTQFDYSSLGIFEHRFQGDKQKSVEAIIHQKE